MNFAFDFGGFAFDCTVNPGNPDRIELRSVLGRLPFTAQSPWGRLFLLRLLDRAQILPSGQFLLHEDGTVRLEAYKSHPLPLHGEPSHGRDGGNAPGIQALRRTTAPHPGTAAGDEPGTRRAQLTSGTRKI